MQGEVAFMCVCCWGVQLDVRRMDGSLVQSGGLGASVNNALHIGWPAHSAPEAALAFPHGACFTSCAGCRGTGHCKKVASANLA